MMRRAYILMVMGAVFALGIAVPSPMHVSAQAQATPYSETEPPKQAITAPLQTQTTGGTVKSCDDIAEAKDGILIGKIVPCLVFTIQESTIKFAADFVGWIAPLLNALLIFVVVLYGIRVLQQEPEIYKHGFVLLVKIAVISIILTDLGNVEAYDGSGGGGKLIPAVYGIMEESQKVVTGAISTSSLKCDVANYGGPDTPPVWATMDCVMGKLWGFVKGDSGKPSMLLVTSVAGLLTGFLFGGAWGVVVFFGMIAVLFSIFMLVIRTVVGFLTGYLVICLLLIMSPLMLPLAFLRGTAQYYESYWRTILASFLAPVLITAYSMFALLIYDQMLFAPDSIVAKLFSYDKIKNAVQAPKAACDRNVTGDPLDVRFDTKPTDAERDSLLSMPNLQKIGFPTLSGGNDVCGTIKLSAVKLDKIDGAGKEADDLKKIFMELVQLFLLGYLVNQGQAMLSGIISQLVGRNSVTTGVTQLTENSKFTSAYGRARESAINHFRKKPGDPNSGFVSGGDLVKSLPREAPSAMKDATTTYFNTLKKK